LDEIYEPLNSGSTHLRLIERKRELPQTPFMTRRLSANPKRRISMKSKRTLVLAASILVLTLGAFPHRASAASDNFLRFTTAASHASVLSTVVSYAASLLL
jgi:hypothetical protein